MGKFDWVSCLRIHVSICLETVCLVVDCGEFPALLNGKVHVIHTTYQSRVNLTCEDGYNLVGASSAVCLANGTWSNEIPRCIGKDELCVCVCVCMYVCIYVCMYV